MTRKSWSKSDLKKFRQLWTSGVLACDMAVFFGVRASAIHNKARAIGLPKRPREDAPRKDAHAGAAPIFDIDNPDHRRKRLAEIPTRIECGITVYECPPHHAEGYDRDLKWK